MIEAEVVPYVPSVGANIDNRSTLRAIATPRVFIPDNALKVSTNETMQVDGTLIINGSLIGGGLPQPDAPATALNNLTDVSLENIQLGESLKWNGSRWTNEVDQVGLTEVALTDATDVGFDDLQNGDILRYDGSRWTNGEDKSGGNRLSELIDIDPSGLSNGATLQYNSSTFKWEFVTETDFIDATLDGGGASSEYLEVFDIDGGTA